MKKKVMRRTHHRHIAKRTHVSDSYLVMVRGWMLVVAFALMLGTGLIVGSYINQQMALSSPTVAGVTTTK